MLDTLASASLNPSFWDVVWLMIIFLALLVGFVIVVYVFIDNFSRHDHGGWAKAGWTILILFAPIIGILAYIIARPSTPSVA